jgi:glutathione S-transferase
MPDKSPEITPEITPDITIVIGNKNYSSWSLRPWLALKQTGAAFEEVVIPLRASDSTAAIRAYSPSGKVPFLRHGQIEVWESLAICEYLAEAFPAAKLWPGPREARALARSVSSEMHAGFAALRNALPMDMRARKPLPALTPELEANIVRVTRIWNDCRARFGAGGPFLFGTFTIADAMFAPIVSRCRTYGVALDAVCRGYAEAILAWPAMAEWDAAAKVEPWTIQY